MIMFPSPPTRARVTAYYRQVLASNASQSGLTLLECLVAVLVASVITTLITPPIFLAVATQVQNRRAEQALQIAQGEVDRVRVLMEIGTQITTDSTVVPKNTDVPETPPSKIASLLKTPRSVCTGATVVTADSVQEVDTVLPIDINGDCESDFYMQTLRTAQATDPRNPNRLLGFQMVVRVYSNVAQTAISDGEAAVEPARLGMTSATGIQSKRPLAVLRTTIFRGDTETSLDSYRQYLGD